MCAIRTGHVCASAKAHACLQVGDAYVCLQVRACTCVLRVQILGPMRSISTLLNIFIGMTFIVSFVAISRIQRPRISTMKRVLASHTRTACLCSCSRHSLLRHPCPLCGGEGWGNFFFHFGIEL